MICERCDASISDKEVAMIVHGILGRSILIKYLEERRDSLNNSVFPAGFFSSFKAKAQCYSDILENKESTYALFNELERHFHGDIFPLTEHEKDVITAEDLFELKLFLGGDIDLSNNQLTLWPLYSFNVIPIQLISSIYEMFFHLQDSESENGTYYTPFHLVEMLTDEVFPWEAHYRDIRGIGSSVWIGYFFGRSVSENDWSMDAFSKSNKHKKRAINQLDGNQIYLGLTQMRRQFVSHHLAYV